MEVEIQQCKRSRVPNGGTVTKDDDEADRKKPAAAITVAGGHVRSSWPQHASSRIFRVSRASGGKDRHSKVLTAKGLRDRRVRLSVSTAIHFYDLQDRLGYDQPSKAVEWLIKNASAAIADLPPLDGPFPDPTLLPAAKCTAPSDATAGDNYQHLSLTKSGFSSNSDTSKGSDLSLSRSEMRSKARERARERTTTGKVDKVVENKDHHDHQISTTLNSPNSFTELLTGGVNNNNNTAAATVANQSSTIPKATTDYFGHGSSIFSQPTQPQKFQHQQQQFLSQPHFGITPTMVPLSMGEHHELQQISFLAQDHVIPVAAMAPPADLNFSISSGIAGLNNRGTLQSNSPLQFPHHHLQKFSSPLDGSNLSFFFSPAAPIAATGAATSSSDNQFLAAAAAGGFDARLQLYYTDGYRHSDIKGKGKN